MGRHGYYVIDADGHGGEPRDWRERIPRAYQPRMDQYAERMRRHYTGLPGGGQKKGAGGAGEVKPAVEPLVHAGLTGEALVREASRANVRASANHLRHGSDILEEQIQKHGLLVVGAEYALETGVVDFFDGIPRAG